MKKYIIVSYIEGDIDKPYLYSDEKEAYSTYANILLDDIDEITCSKNDEISNEEFDNFRNIFNNESVSTIKSAIEVLISKYMKNYNISKLPNGYKFNNSDYILEIFELDEI